MNDSNPSTASLTTSSRGTRILGVATIISGVVAIAYAFWFSDADVELGNTVRMLYIHVPTVSIAYLCMIINAVCSGLYLWRRTQVPDLWAAATGEIGTMLLGLTLVVGMLWGRPTWGSYWSWGDPRLTSTLLLFLLYVGYVTVRNIPAPLAVRNTRSAVIGIVSALMIYPVRMSTVWFESIHQGRTIKSPGASAIKGNQELALYFGFLAFALLATWLTIHRFRVGWLSDQVAATELDEVLVERRNETAESFGLEDARP